LVDNNVKLLLTKMASDEELFKKTFDLCKNEKWKDAVELLSTHDINVSSEDLQRTLALLNSPKKVPLKEQQVMDAFKEGLIDDLNAIKRGYEKVMQMYVVAFYVGVFLIVTAVYTALDSNTDNNLLGIVFGGVGTADIITSFIYRPAQELQNSRGNLVQLKCAFFNWLNDVSFWNGYLNIKANNGQPLEYEEVRKVSKILLENLAEIMRLIDQYTETREDKSDKK
jgi:hypothetical protein